MIIHDTGKGARLSLAAQIEQVESNINIRRQIMSERTFLLKQHVRQRLVSPAALITYAGAGLAVGLLTRRPRNKPAHTPSPKLVRIEQFLAKVFKVVAIGRTLATLLPEASTPRTRSGVSTAPA